MGISQAEVADEKQGEFDRHLLNKNPREKSIIPEIENYEFFLKPE
jgi:hypothetical protein